MTVDWVTMWQGFWLGAGFWTATVSTFLILILIVLLVSALLGIFDAITKRGDDDDKKRKP